MGHVQDLWYKSVSDSATGGVRRVKTRLHGKGQRYRVRYIDPSGRERSRSFPDRQKKQADDYLAAIEHDKRAGTYHDPRAGDVRFGEYAAVWLASQTVDQATRETVEKRLANRIYPYFENRLLSSLTPTDIRSWQRGLHDAGLAASYRKAIFVYLQAILDGAVDDGKIRTNPCRAKSVRPPQSAPRAVTPWSAEQVQAVRDRLPVELRVAVALGAGLGLRYGEAAALAVEDIDFEEHVVHVVRGVKSLRGGVCFAPPKGGKTRSVPLPDSVADALREHLAHYPAVTVTLPWRSCGGHPVTAQLILHNRYRRPVWRSNFTEAWRKAVHEVTGGPGGWGDGFHALRHFYASTLLDAGESIIAVSRYLGHTDPGFTLRTYTHLMPASHDRTRRTVDTTFADSSHGLETA